MVKTGMWLMAVLSIAGLFFSPIFLTGVNAPMPPEVAVNHETKQCATVIRGDECVTCNLPVGWEIIGRAPEAQCPAGYAEVDLQLECKGEKRLRCCLPGHSGGQGDCIGWALEGLLYCSPCLVFWIVVAAVVLWLDRRKKKIKE